MKSDMKITDDRLEITRMVDAPRERVFAAWSRPELLQRWTGCKDATDIQCEMDFRVGGTFTQKMHITGAGDCVIKGTYEEIVAPEKIVYRVDLAGHGTARVMVEFFAQGDQTKMVLVQDGFPNPMVTKFVSQGTMESFDKLDLLFAGQAMVSQS
jgi:uncharacterized protein YndB with AHSA1/START domain